MLVQASQGQSGSAHVVVLGNEKGGSGKSTTALHIAVALLKAGQRVATIDLDCRQQSFTRYISNRSAWARRTGLDLELPTHCCIELGETHADRREREFRVRAVLAAVIAVERTLRLHRHRYAGHRQLPDAAGAFDGRHAGHADQRQLPRFRCARHRRSRHLRGDRREPLRRDGARRQAQAPRRSTARPPTGSWCATACRCSARATSNWSPRA